MLQFFRCLFGRHRRDSRRVKIGEDGNERSVCRGCGRPMIKEYRGATGWWRLAD